MLCCVDGCERLADYKGKALCQKHYFRIRRTGTADTRATKRKYRYSNPAGYQLIFEPNHPMASKNGYAYEHRFVLYNSLGGIIDSCSLCGKPESWATCHVDHIDNDNTNNNSINLRVCCRACNVMRGHMSKENSFGCAHMLTHDGKTLSPWKWASQDGVTACGATIKRRKDMGLSDFEAIFAKKKTHVNSESKKKAYRDWSY